MQLKAIDLGLMAEHLDVHKGVIKKLKSYFCSSKNPTLRQIIYEQILIMSNHVGVMLNLIDPTINETVTVSALNQLQHIEIPCRELIHHVSDKTISLEGSHIAKTMSQGNYNSALRMKTHNVKDIHLQMAFQQFRLQERYENFIKGMGWSHEPNVTLEEQNKTVKNYKDMYHL
jgi:hypothetical protein